MKYSDVEGNHPLIKRNCAHTQKKKTGSLCTLTWKTFLEKFPGAFPNWHAILTFGDIIEKNWQTPTPAKDPLNAKQRAELGGIPPDKSSTVSAWARKRGIIRIAYSKQLHASCRFTGLNVNLQRKKVAHDRPPNWNQIKNQLPKKTTSQEVESFVESGGFISPVVSPLTEAKEPA